MEAVLGKEIQLMHRAPVVWICVLDGRGRPLPEPLEASRDLAAAPDMSSAHSVLIASEEQLKVRGAGPGLWRSCGGGGDGRAERFGEIIELRLFRPILRFGV